MHHIDISDRPDFVVMCGDIHGEFETIVNEITVRRAIRDATVIVAGDCGFGFNKILYYENLYKYKLHQKLAKANVLLLMVRGNHDDPLFFEKRLIDYPYLKTVPDYTVVRTCSHNILCVGGAISIDRTYRWSIMDFERKRLPVYWPDEPFCYDEYELQLMEDEGIRIDTVVTHSAPGFCPPYHKDGLMDFFVRDEDLHDDIKRERSEHADLYRWLKTHNHPLKAWYYGHFHSSKTTLYEDTTFHLLNINELKTL